MGTQVFALVFPGLHPLAVAPAVGTKKGDVLTVQFRCALQKQRLKFKVLQLLCAHGRAAKSNGVIVLDLGRGEVRGGEQVCLRTGSACALCHSLCHLSRIACAAPINDRDFFHNKFLSVSKKILSNFYCKLFHIPLPAKEQTAIYAGAFAEFTKGTGGSLRVGINFPNPAAKAVLAVVLNKADHIAQRIA